MTEAATRSKRGPEAGGRRLRLTGFLLLPLTVFPLLSLISYDWRDISLLQAPPNDPPVNMFGLVGAWCTFGAYVLLGLGAWLLPFWLALFCLLAALGRGKRMGARLGWCALIQAMCCALLQLGDGIFAGLLDRLDIAPNPGGLCGWLLMTMFLERFLSPVGGTIVALTLLLAGVVMAVGPHELAAAGTEAGERFHAWRLRRADESRRLEMEQRRLERRLAAEQRRAAREAARQEREEQRRRRAEARETARRERESREEAWRRDQETRKEQMRLEREREEAAARQAAETPAAKEPPPPPLSPPAAPAPAAAETPPAPTAATAEPPPEEAPPPYQLPGVDLLSPLPAGEAVHGDIDRKAQILVKTLADFGIDAEVTHIEKGPVVTSFELLPAPGIRVERIAGMARNLEMALKAVSVRVEAPIPGKGVVGVETPNEKARPVTVRELLEGARWAECVRTMEIPLLLGKNIGGRDLVVDLAAMPHLLIAGATGSGKSVCINAMLTGLLMSRRPEEVRLMLVDPKIVEFAVFGELPHLVAPVITDPRKVALGLRWAIQEMEKRYKLLHAAGVRNIAAFNRRRQTAVQPDMFAPEQEERAPSADNLPARLPYILIIIDELADLMLQAGPEIENCVARLAQLSRAVGIHLIIATQRPSVNIITGTIKANFPGRIAFQVAQRVDSRTIIDCMGAEALIGRGDMLFLDPRTSKLVRAQGAFIGDADTRRVVDFIRAQSAPVYIREVQERLARAGTEEEGEEEAADGAGEAADGSGEVVDEYFDQAVAIIRETRRASTSSLQRRLRIGYTRAARLMDVMEERGIVGPPRGADPREILIDLDGEIPQHGGPDGGAAGDGKDAGGAEA
jgi:S-DNA-T family DNA segregation ATPase FtsK/SpoIIIE